MVIISAVICTYNRCDRLCYALDALTKQSLPGDRWEVIVVDNASTDQTKELCDRYVGQFTNFVYVYEPILGLSRARNRAIEVAKGEYIAYLDDDAIPCAVWLEAILHCFQTVQPQPVGIGGRILALWEIPRPAWLSDHLAEYYTVLDDGEQSHWFKPGRYPYGANMAYVKRAIAETGRFSEELGRKGDNLLSAEELLLHDTLKRSGGQFYYCGVAIVEHWVSKKRMSLEWLIQRAYWQGRSDAIVDQLLNISNSQIPWHSFWKLKYFIRELWPLDDNWQLTIKIKLYRVWGYFLQMRLI